MTYALIMVNTVELITKFRTKSDQQETFQMIKDLYEGENVTFAYQPTEIMFATFYILDPDADKEREIEFDLNFYRADFKALTAWYSYTPIKLFDCGEDEKREIIEQYPTLGYSNNLQLSCFDPNDEQAFLSGSIQYKDQSTLVYTANFTENFCL